MDNTQRIIIFNRCILGNRYRQKESARMAPMGENSIDLKSTFIFRKMIKNIGLNWEVVSDSDLKNIGEFERNYLNFIFNERLKTKIENSKFLKIFRIAQKEGEDLFLVYNPECPKGKIYDFFFFYHVTISNIENSLMNFISFKEQYEGKKLINFSRQYYIYIPFNSEKANTMKQILSPYQDKLEYIDFNYELNKKFRIRILLGEKSSQLSLNGQIEELSFLSRVKDFILKM
jgi:hypothetical protein